MVLGHEHGVSLHMAGASQATILDDRLQMAGTLLSGGSTVQPDWHWSVSCTVANARPVTRVRTGQREYLQGPAGQGSVASGMTGKL